MTESYLLRAFSTSLLTELFPPTIIRSLAPSLSISDSTLGSKELFFVRSIGAFRAFASTDAVIESGKISDLAIITVFALSKFFLDNSIEVAILSSPLIRLFETDLLKGAFEDETPPFGE